MTDCIRFEDDLKAYADGELPWLRRRAVRRHLAHCASCQEEITTMTQIAEDLRASDTEDALPAALREKILENGPPAPILGSRSRKASSSPVPPELGARGRKRPALGWAIAGIALVAWFVFFPLYQRNLVNGVHEDRVASQVMPASATVHGALKLPPPKPVSLQVRLSDREAGNGHPYIKIKNPDSQFQNTSGLENSNATGNVDGTLHVHVVRPMAAPQMLSVPPDVNGNSLRQVHKEASIGVQVPNPETTSDTVETMVTATGGYVASNNLSTGDDGLKSAELVVKVPVTQFETFMAQVAKLGKVQSKNITGEDITEQTSDADQEENVLEDDVQKSEARLKALGSKAKWRDEEATRELRIQLAQSRARLVLLKRMAALGTLTVDLSQTPKAVTPAPVTGGFMSGLKGTTHDALQSLLGSAGALVALVIWLLAYAPIWVPLLLIGRYALKEYRKQVVV